MNSDIYLEIAFNKITNVFLNALLSLSVAVSIIEDTYGKDTTITLFKNNIFVLSSELNDAFRIKDVNERIDKLQQIAEKAELIIGPEFNKIVKSMEKTGKLAEHLVNIKKSIDDKLKQLKDLSPMYG